MPTRMSDYRFPPASASEDERSGHFREVIQMGEQWLRAQRPHKAIREAKDLIFGYGGPDIPAGQSGVNVPRTKRGIRELVSIFSNLRPTSSNRTDNEDFQQQADVLNKLDRWVWQQTTMDRKFKRSFQAAGVTGTVYVSHIYDPRMKGGIRTDCYGADRVYLINPPEDFDLQQCYAVIFVRTVPIHIIQHAFPLRAAEIVPDHGARAYTQQGLDYVQGFMGFNNSPMRALSGRFDDDARLDDVYPTCDVYEAYIWDQSLNMTGHDVMMGEPGTLWEYKVPAYGSLIPTGTRTVDGLTNYRKATADDARLYPTRRRMIGTSSLILYDNTQQWWYPGVPASRFSFDGWWCEALGWPLTKDTASLERSANDVLRGINDMVNVALDPPMGYDENMVSERLAQRLNPRKPGQRLRMNMTMGEAIKGVLPNNYWNLPQYVPDFPKYLFEQLDYVLGRADVQTIMKARQIPSGDTIEKMMELAGPLAQDMTRELEASMAELGEIRRWLLFQFMPKKQRMEILGDNGVTAEDFDFDPGSLIPSHMQDEDPASPSRFTQMERARAHCAQFEYRVVPNSAARIQSYQRKLILLQLEARGFPLDPWTKAELFEIDDFGPPPKGTKNIVERWIAWMHIQRELAQEMGGAQQGGKRGRPTTGTGPPRIASKDGGSRTTITQSR